MTRRSVRRESVRTIRLEPGRGGRLNTHDHESVRPDDYLTTADNARMDNALSRRAGSENVGDFTVITSAAAGFADASLPYAAFVPPLIPKGGWFAQLALKATRPVAGTVFVVSSQIAGKGFGTFSITVSSVGLVTWAWRDEAGEDNREVSATFADGTALNSMPIYDPVAGTFTVYVDGAPVGATLTGLPSDLQPMQDATTWYFGTGTDGAGTPTVGSQFEGVIDGWHLGALRGVDISQGLLDELKLWTLAEWRNPGSRMTLSCFDFNNMGVAPTTIKDRSDFQNDATVVGTITSTTELLFSAQNGNKVERVQGPAGRVDNMVMAGGSLFYETIREGTA